MDDTIGLLGLAHGRNHQHLFSMSRLAAAIAGIILISACGPPNRTASPSSTNSLPSATESMSPPIQATPLQPVASSAARLSTPPHLPPLPSIAGERLMAGSTRCSNCGTLTTNATCSQTSTSTINFSARGVAAGDYAGTFTAKGTALLSTTSSGNYSIEPLNLVTKVDADFVITSAKGDIAGSIHMSGTGIWGTCHTYAATVVGNTGRAGSGFYYSVQPVWAVDTTYVASITTTIGVWKVQGNGALGLTDLNVTAESGPEFVVNSNAFDAAFTTANIVGYPPGYAASGAR